MSSQNYTQHTQTLRAKYLKTDQMDEEEKEVNDSQNELCQAHGLNVAHVQEPLRILVSDPLKILVSKKLTTKPKTSCDICGAKMFK